MSERPSAATAFLILVRDLCQLRRGPENMPYSPALLGLLIAASVILDLMTGALTDDASNMLARSLLSTALVLGLCWIALAVRRLSSRYVQTATAVIACSIAFSLLILPIVWLASPLPATPEQLTPLQMLASWVALAILVWSLVVTAHILKHALEAPFLLGFALALAWWVAVHATDQALFGAAA